jgi:hypothetical protein
VPPAGTAPNRGRRLHTRRVGRDQARRTPTDASDVPLGIYGSEGLSSQPTRRIPAEIGGRQEQADEDQDHGDQQAATEESPVGWRV